MSGSRSLPHVFQNDCENDWGAKIFSGAPPVGRWPALFSRRSLVWLVWVAQQRRAAMGISRHSLHKRRATGGKKVAIHKKRKYDMGRQAANTKLSNEQRTHTVRGRGGKIKFRALRMHTGNFAWGGEGACSLSRLPAAPALVAFVRAASRGGTSAPLPPPPAAHVAQAGTPLQPPPPRVRPALPPSVDWLRARAQMGTDRGQLCSDSWIVSAWLAADGVARSVCLCSHHEQDSYR